MARDQTVSLRSRGRKVAASLGMSPLWTLWQSLTSLSVPLVEAPLPRPQQPGNIKYAGIATTHTFVPVAVQSMGPLGHEASARETSHPFQQVSVFIQCYNAVAFRGSFVEEDDDVSG